MGTFYDVIPQGKNHYRIGSKEAVFMDLFVGSEKALLFDTGYGYGKLKEQVKEITELPLIIVNSHGHLDHTCGNNQFKEDIYIHKKDIELCMEHTSEQQRMGAIENGKHNFDFVTGQVENILPEGFEEEAYIHGGSGNLVPIAEGEQFDLGGIILTVYELPGHTAGSIGLYWEEEKLLFVGDALNPFIWLFMPEALKLADYKATLTKAYAMDFTHYYMAHNPLKTEKQVILDYMDAAEHADFEKGFPFETPLAPGIKARICARDGYGPQDFNKPGFASIVLSEEHL